MLHQDQKALERLFSGGCCFLSIG